MAKPTDSTTPPRRKGKPDVDPAFDAWLKRGLHQMFDDIANEPVPDELLRLIEKDQSA